MRCTPLQHQPHLRRIIPRAPKRRTPSPPPRRKKAPPPRPGAARGSSGAFGRFRTPVGRNRARCNRKRGTLRRLQTSMWLMCFEICRCSPPSCFPLCAFVKLPIKKAHFAFRLSFVRACLHSKVQGQYRRQETKGFSIRPRPLNRDVPCSFDGLLLVGAKSSQLQTPAAHGRSSQMFFDVG